MVFWAQIPLLVLMYCTFWVDWNLLNLMLNLLLGAGRAGRQREPRGSDRDAPPARTPHPGPSDHADVPVPRMSPLHPRCWDTRGARTAVLPV